MKGRFLIVITALALLAAACAGDLAEPPAPGDTASATDAASQTVDGAPDATNRDQEEPQAGQPVPTTAQGTGSTTTPVGASSGSENSHPTTVDDVSGLQPLIDQAVADLAKRLGVDSATVALVRAELVVWPDASLGCPQPGMEYPQVPTDGSLIVLSYGGREYRYHTGGNRYVPFLCETPAAPDKAPPPLDGYGGPDT